jgi:hypothetical protein
MQNLATVFDFLFGCHHSNLSRVFTIRRQTYRVCCDCGTAFKYSLETMSIVRRLPENPELAPLRAARKCGPQSAFCRRSTLPTFRHRPQ